MLRATLAAAVIGAVGASAAGCTSAGPGHPSASSSPAAATSAPTTPVASPSQISSSARASSAPATRSSAPSVALGLPAVSFPPGTGPVIVLNPGHNGGNAANPAVINQQVPAGFGEYKACDTTGTNTDAGYTEHAFNWDVALRVRSILQAHGVRVVLTRPSDTGVGPCVDQRAAIGNEPGVAAVVSIHSDGAPPQDHGFHVCYASRPPAGAAVQAQSVRLSQAIHDALLRGSGFVPAAYIGDGNGYFPRSDLAALNLAMGPSTFLEIGNMRNSNDASVESSAAGRERIAMAVASGILNWLAAR